MAPGERSSSSKQAKKSRGSDIGESRDRISDLPDTILVDILSRLPLTKEAVRISVLSKRWRPHWTHLHRLSFSLAYDSGRRAPLPPISSLAICLFQHASPKVTQLDIAVDTDLPWDSDSDNSEVDRSLKPSELFKHHVDVLLSFARRKHVEIFSLDYAVNRYPGEEPVPYMFRRGFYPCSSAREFKTACCNLKDFGLVNWSALRVLEVGFCDFSDFDALDTLKLYDCLISRLIITSSSLKKLVINKIWDENWAPEVRVSAPFLEHLEIVSVNCSDASYTLIDVSSLAIANIDLHHNVWRDVDVSAAKQTAAIELLQKVCHVKELRMGAWYIKALLAWRMQVLPALSCKCLILHLCGRDCYAYPGLKSLLQSSSIVEKLVLHFEDYDTGGNHLQDFIGSMGDWKTSCAEFDCFRHYLKIIHVHGLRDSHENLYILEFLLKHATVLEKMVVHEIKSSRALDKLIFSKKLLDFPRSSSVAVVRLPDDVDKNTLALL